MDYTKQDLKKIWNVELDLLDKLKEICSKYALTYCASSGTLLGAVRHKGFIPWDDDIDIFLMWDDYKKLMEVAPKECKEPYFFQCIYTEKNAMPGACRLRRSDTTCFTKWEYDNMPEDYDRGIFIDIFPLFYVPDSLDDREGQKEKVFYYWKCVHGYDALDQKKRKGYVNPEYEKYIPLYESYCMLEDASGDIVSLKEKYLNACAFDNKPSKVIGATSFKCHNPKLMWKSEWYAEYIDLPFEDTTIPCPKEYEKILEVQYGDWKTPVVNGALHEMIIIDTDKTWKEYPIEELCRGR